MNFNTCQTLKGWSKDCEVFEISEGVAKLWVLRGRGILQHLQCLVYTYVLRIRVTNFWAKRDLIFETLTIYDKCYIDV